MLKRIIGWFKSERGQDMVEYALITGAIAVGITAVALLFVPAVQSWWTDLATWFGTLAP